MKIGVLGSGMVAKVLGSGFLSHGHSVMLGTRDSGKLADWQSENPQGQVGSFSATAAFGEVVVLAVKGSVAAQALAQSGAENLAGKPVIDATNPIADAPPVKGVLQFFTDQNGSLMEDLQAQFPDAHLVKAFNSVGSARMVNPTYAAGKPTMFICGNESAARETVGELVEQFGWEVADMGTAEAARAIEPLCMLWCIPGFREGRWSNAFRLLKK